MIDFTLTITLTCEEDLHVGDGIAELGRHHAGFSRNAENKPWIPRSTFRGVLREACRKVVLESRALGIDKFDNKTLKDIFDYGAGDSPIISPLRTMTSETDDDRFITHTFVAVDLDGRATDGALRSLQCVRAGTVFNGAIHGRTPSQTHLELLEYGLNRIHRIGGSRNRGLGRVRITYSLDTKVPPKAEMPKWVENLRDDCTLIWKCSLEDMAAFARDAPAGNIQYSQDHIPSESVWGTFRHIARTSLACTKEAELSFLDDPQTDMPGLVMGAMLPYPKHVALTALHPSAIFRAPKSLRLPKQESSKDKSFPPWFRQNAGKADLAALGARDEFSLGEKGEIKKTDLKYKKFSDFIYHDQAGLFHRLSTTLVRNLRNEIDERTGQVKGENLFTEECLAEDQEFFGWARFARAEDARHFLTMFAPWLPLNGKAALPLGLGRGRKPARIVELNAIPTETRQEVKYSSVGTITFLSACLVRGEDGTYAHRLTEKDLAFLLGLPPETKITILSRCEDAGSITRMHGSGGFFEPPEIAISAGSSYRIYFGDVGHESWETILEARATALGERTHQGYGRWALNHPIHQLNGEPSGYMGTKLRTPTILNSHSQSEQEFREAKVLFNQLEKHNVIEKGTRAKLGTILHILESAPEAEPPPELWSQLADRANKNLETLWNAEIIKKEESGKNSKSFPSENPILLHAFLKEKAEKHKNSWILIHLLRIWMKKCKEEKS